MDELIKTILHSPWFWAIARIVIVLAVVLLSVPFLVLWERKLLGYFQDRVGPNRVGWFGILQTIADGIKLFFKEEIRPKNSDTLIFWLAPAIALLPALTSMATIPWGPMVPVLMDVPSSYMTPIADVNIGVLWFIAISSTGVYGMALAGWSSNNKYALLGGLRASAQLISYELAMGLTIGVVALTAGSLKLTEIVAAQQSAWLGAFEWFRNWHALTPLGFCAFLIFLICMVAETNRSPFDLPEAESELIAGFHTEYSSMKFACFYMSEYANMLILSALATTLFLGGYSFIIPINPQMLSDWISQYGHGMTVDFLKIAETPLMSWVWFLIKTVTLFSFFIWLRATLPRLRYDHLMDLGWKGLLPLSLILIILTATRLTFGWQLTSIISAGIAAVYVIIAVALAIKQRKLRRRINTHKNAVPLS